MDNRQIASLLLEISRILEIKEENVFKIRAYQNAARSLEGIGEEAHDLIAQGKLKEVPGIGKAIAEKIEELDQTGKLQYYEELKSGYPATLFELFRIPNLGPKKIRKLYEDLGIGSIRELEYACQENRLLNLKGFGKKTQEKLLEGIKIAEVSDGRRLLGKVLPVAQRVLEYLRECKAAEKVEIAGSTRRWKEIVNDLDFVASTTKAAEVTEHFLKMPFATSLIARGETKTSVRIESLGLNVDLRVVAPKEFASALHHFTGSKEHNVVLRMLAKKKGYKINEYGIFPEDSEKPLPIKSEKDIYAFFKMDYIPPEMRENLGEIEAAQEHRIPQLVQQSDIAGVFHVHSVWSDGHNSLEEMIRGAVERGYHYVGISEHSQVAAYAHGLDSIRLKEQSEEIDKLQKKYSAIRILKGVEVDILPDGALDLDDASLSRLDFVIASVHSAFRLEEKAMTERICRALAHPLVDILGHPTGRILQGRAGYAVNLEEVFKTAVRHKKCIEINASPHRLDLDWTHVKQAVDLGIPLSINPDAHRVTEFDYVPFGVGMARKGWAAPGDILNTRTWDEIARKRKRKTDG